MTSSQLLTPRSYLLYGLSQTPTSTPSEDCVCSDSPVVPVCVLTFRVANPTRKEKKIVKSALVPFGGRVERDGPIIQQLNSHLSRENPKLNDRALTDLTVLGMRYIVRNRMLQAGRGPLAKDDFSDLGMLQPHPSPLFARNMLTLDLCLPCA